MENSMIKKITDTNGQPWTAAIVGNLVKFYDAHYMHTDMGQFVSTYYISTILDGDDCGLNLDGGVPTWQISAVGMKEIRDWLKINNTSSEMCV